MALILLDSGHNQAHFGNDETQQNQGFIFWSDLENLKADLYKLSFSGFNTIGNTISPTQIEVEIQGEINPTKVFWAVYKAAKKLLCPDCNKGY